jgi:hypothetical protein
MLRTFSIASRSTASSTSIPHAIAEPRAASLADFTNSGFGKVALGVIPSIGCSFLTLVSN